MIDELFHFIFSSFLLFFFIWCSAADKKNDADGLMEEDTETEDASLHPEMPAHKLLITDQINYQVKTEKQLVTKYPADQGITIFLL